MAEISRILEAIERLAEEERKMADLVKFRFFAGLTIHQAAEILGLPHRTADRYWAYARTWLYRERCEGDESG